LNEKFYVGLTTKTIWERMAGHLKTGYNNGRQKNDLDDDIRDLGMENFSVEVLFESSDYFELLCQEKEEIYKSKALLSGYNKRSGTSNTERELQDTYRELYQESLRGKKVINTKTGEIYRTIKEASEKIGVDRYTIRRHCDGYEKFGVHTATLERDGRRGFGNYLPVRWLKI
jgi:hypothetical protein